MSYAVIQTGGKQYRVAEGDVVEIEKLDGDAGAEMIFANVLLAGEGADLKMGDALKEAKVVGEVVEQFKGPKLLAYRYKRRKGYHRTVGHRQKLTRVRITSIAI
ncbi:MAG: 50S ribosomal protein L21 [Verrucomicrobiota bacterium]|nr:50S ribosomal protein L21 [Verrucomicrobiota bacterium]